MDGSLGQGDAVDKVSKAARSSVLGDFSKQAG